MLKNSLFKRLRAIGEEPEPEGYFGWYSGRRFYFALDKQQQLEQLFEQALLRRLDHNRPRPFETHWGGTRGFGYMCDIAVEQRNNLLFVTVERWPSSSNTYFRYERERLKAQAIALATILTEAGITPDNEKIHPAYNANYDTLSYSHDTITWEDSRMCSSSSCSLAPHLGTVIHDRRYAALVAVFGPLVKTEHTIECDLKRHNGKWVLFDEYGDSYVPITWTGTVWEAYKIIRC